MGSDDRLVTIATFGLPVEAHIARSKLESEGIDAIVADDNIVSINWLYSSAVGGVKLQVPESQALRAREILDAVTNTGKEGEVVLLPCPKCHAPSVKVENASFWQRFFGMFAFLFGSPWPVKRVWRCANCGHTVKE